MPENHCWNALPSLASWEIIAVEHNQNTKVDRSSLYGARALPVQPKGLPELPEPDGFSPAPYQKINFSPN